MMADFVDDAVQKLLQQAEERLSGGRIVAKKQQQASTDSKTTTARAAVVGEAVDASLLPPKQEKTEVRVPRPQGAAAQRKGKVRIVD